MLLRLRYEIDTPQRLREHLHLVEGAGYFFFPGASAPQGTPVVLALMFTSTDQSALLRGFVWARPSAGGIWIELLDAARCLETMESVPRTGLRVATDVLVLAEGTGRAPLLCRLRDAGNGGARVAANASDLGDVDGRVKITLPEAGPSGGQLEAFGRIAWTRSGEAGIEWAREDLTSRAAIRRLLELADEEWQCARTASHPQTCRCMKSHPQMQVVLLG